MTNGITNEVDVTTIPLPSQIPSRVDLSHIPPQALRSAAIEALTNQNEDLMARLSVALRRSAQIEERILELEKERDALHHRLSVAQDQVLVIQEKDRLLSERVKTHDAEIARYREQVQLLESQFAEVYATSREKQKHAQKHIDELAEQLEGLTRRLKRFLKYRKSIARVTERFRQIHADTVLNLRTEQQTNRDLKAKLGDAVNRIQTLAKESDANQRKLVDNYEGALKELREQKLDLEKQNKTLLTKTENYNILVEDKITLENRLILEQRQFTEYREQKEIEHQSLESSLTQFRAEQKSQAIEIDNLKSHLEQNKTELQAKTAQNSQLQDQIESLQFLWQNNQEKLEKQESKNESLNKLNQQLSSTIHQLRKELQTLRAQLENQSIQTTEKMKEIKGALSLIQPGQLNFIEGYGEAKDTGKFLSRLDQLMAEIQSGFSLQKPSEASEGSSNPVSGTGDKRGSVATSTP